MLSHQIRATNRHNASLRASQMLLVLKSSCCTFFERQAGFKLQQLKKYVSMYIVCTGTEPLFGSSNPSSARALSFAQCQEETQTLRSSTVLQLEPYCCYVGKDIILLSAEQQQMFGIVANLSEKLKKQNRRSPFSQCYILIVVLELRLTYNTDKSLLLSKFSSKTSESWETIMLPGLILLGKESSGVNSPTACKMGAYHKLRQRFLHIKKE